MEFNEELKKQAKEIFSLYAKHSPSGYAITEEDFIWTLAEYDSRQTKVSRVELPVILQLADKAREEHRKKKLLHYNNNYAYDLGNAEKLRGYLKGIEWMIERLIDAESKLSK